MAKKTVDRAPSSLELSGFCTEVALMLSSGMAIYDGMETLAQTNSKSADADLYTKAAEAVIRTGTLYEALKEDPRWPVYLVEMVGIGERTGRLEEVMNGLARFYERESRIRSAVVSAVTYPIVLGVMMLLIVMIMILKVLPVFRRVLSSMGIAMTASSSRLMQIGVATGWTVLIIVGILVLAVLAVILLLRTDKREGVMALLQKLFPPIGKLNRRLSSSRVASVLSMMLSGGFPLEEALDMVPNVLPDKSAASAIGAIRDKLNAGTPFADALTESGLFDDLHTRMIRMAIAAGREDEIMAKVAGLYEEQVEEGISGLVSIIEPTLVALLSIVIGAVMLSVMLPMAGIISSIL